MNEITLDYVIKEILLTSKRIVKDQEDVLRKLEKVEEKLKEKSNNEK